MPYSFENPDDNAFNAKLLLQRVNEPDAFDVDIKAQEGDRLQLSFQCKEAMSGYINYGFTYKGHKWIEEEFDSLIWMWHHNRGDFGEIKSVTEKRWTIK